MSDIPIFTCTVCWITFGKARSDDEAKAESTETFGLEVTKATHDVVCEDCYRKLVTPNPSLPERSR